MTRILCQLVMLSNSIDASFIHLQTRCFIRGRDPLVHSHTHSLSFFEIVPYCQICCHVMYMCFVYIIDFFFLHYCLCMGPYDVFISSSKIMVTCYFYFIQFIPLIHLFLSMVMPQLFIKFFSFMLPQEIPLIISSFQNSRKKIIFLLSCFAKCVAHNIIK